MTPNKFVRFCPLFLSLLFSLSALQSTFAQGAQALQLSTRVYLTPGAEAITGFIITGTGTGQKTLVIRGLGPSLPGGLANPVFGKRGLGSVFNDDWSDPLIPPSLQPGPLESAVKMDFGPGSYTAILSGTTSTDFGFALVEVYDLTPGTLRLANISTRAFVGTGDKIVIAGFILDPSGSGLERIVVRGMGPSLSAFGVPDVLADPVLELCCGPGGLPLLQNDDWQDNPAQAAQLIAMGLAPSNSLEAALVATLPPGPYTVLLTGRVGTIGNGLVEVYDGGP